MDNKNGYHNCNTCNKNFKSYKSLWNHKKIFHSNIVLNVDEETTNVVINKKLQCKFCFVNFKSQSNKCQHEKNYCKEKNNVNNIQKDNHELEIKRIELEKMKEEKEKMKEEKEKIKEENKMIRLKIKLQNCKRLDNKTFKAVNKFLMDRSFKNSNNNAINSNNTNNNNTNTVNNYQILAVGEEQLKEILTMKEKKAILNERFCSLEKMVEIAHCGNYNKFKNIIITNLKDNYAYKYDKNVGYFITVTKADLLNDIVTYRITDIEEMYDELTLTNKIDDRTKELIQQMLAKIHDENIPFYDYNEEIKYSNYKSYKMNNIKILLYNNHDKMTKDIAMLFSNEKTIEI
jgi:hypothetical protein